MAVGMLVPVSLSMSHSCPITVAMLIAVQHLNMLWIHTVPLRVYQCHAFVVHVEQCSNPSAVLTLLPILVLQYYSSVWSTVVLIYQKAGKDGYSASKICTLS